MNQAIQLNDVSAFLERHLVEVFETMLTFKASLVSGSHAPDHPNRVCGSVGFAGPNVTGAVYLYLSEEFANRGARAMLGMAETDALGEADVNDVVGEMTNMLTGGLKSWLCDTGSECAVSTPAIIRGNSFSVEAMPDVDRASLQFACGEDRVIVEVHIKLN